MADGKLRDRMALVTGGGSGIGREICRLFAREGAKVAVFEVDRDAGAATVDDIEASGGTAVLFPCDVSRQSEVAEAFAAAFPSARVTLSRGAHSRVTPPAAADQRLTEIRATGMPDAGAMLLASDQESARAYASIVQRVSGEEPVVVLSEDPKASALIDAFANGKQRWIVAVRMVSEGVDIPRLAVGAWATSYRTPLFFAQAVGRFVRARRPNESATLFLPAVRPLLALAAELAELAAAGCPLLLLVVTPAIAGTILARHGTEEQRQRAVTLLDELRRSFYGILAE